VRRDIVASFVFCDSTVTIHQAIRMATERLASEPIGPPHLAAETLLMHVLGCERVMLYAHPERELSADEWSRFHAAVEERAAGKPLQYITGHQEFFGLDFRVSPAVLIPRPETEHLVEAAIEKAKAWERPRVLDVGTGSGCVAIAIAHSLPQAQVTALEISATALEVARINAARLATQVRLLESDLLAAVADEEFDLVVSNPPYVGRCEADKVQREVREHEPDVAVFAGEQGLDIYRRLIPQAYQALAPGGWLLMEIGYSIEQPVRELMGEFAEMSAIADLQGITRVVMGRKAF
jgi:release factor glutamine methyltransferase